MHKMKVIILRFRDLGQVQGYTIEKHKSIIDEKKAVWWSWWRKGNEKIPEVEMSLFKNRAEGGSIEVYLLDSGQKKLYKAECKGIQFAVKDGETVNIPSPDKDLTPEYYRNNVDPIWFKFTSIEECTKEELCKYSYVIVKDLFIDPETNYSMFNDKRIYSEKELIQQNVSMWFAREYQPEDPCHEIILTNANIIEPYDFSPGYYELKSDSLLWLSDLHCSDKITVPIIRSEGEGKNSLADRIVSLADMGGLLISGDITNHGKQQGFEIAERMIQELNNNTSRPFSTETIMFCPGNHDFVRDETEISADVAERIQKESDTVKYYSDFYYKIHNKTPNEYFACGRKYLTACGRTVEIVALNSVMLQQYINFEGQGYLSKDQLDYVAEQMGWKKGEKSATIRIAVMHHHYLPTCYVEDINPRKPGSVVYDANQLMTWLNDYNVRILLHGHKHVPFSAAVETSCESENRIDFSNGKFVYIVGMGSTCVPCSSGNVYGEIRFQRDEINIVFHKLSWDGSEPDQLWRTIKIPV